MAADDPNRKATLRDNCQARTAIAALADSITAVGSGRHVGELCWRCKEEEVAV